MKRTSRTPEALREDLVTRGSADLVVDLLREEDLPLITWAGNPNHVRQIGANLIRQAVGELEYLVVRAPDGQPIALGCVEYAFDPASGDVGQLTTRPDLQGLGLATRLISEAERRIGERGRHLATLGVDVADARARALYERLGYHVYGRAPDSWERLDDEGKTYLYETEVLRMKKGLSS